jgi:hypothetical protein
LQSEISTLRFNVRIHLFFSKDTINKLRYNTSTPSKDIQSSKLDDFRLSLRYIASSWRCTACVITFSACFAFALAFPLPFALQLISQHCAAEGGLHQRLLKLYRLVLANHMPGDFCKLA